MLNQNIYQVFIRNHTLEGTIQALISDLKRIKEMGFDVLYIMPFHPISKLNRKGTYGSPYAIANYYEVSEDLGTLDDFKELINQVHQHKMSLIIDIVFNHAGADHQYASTNPEFFILDENNQPTRKVADWSDIIDYDFSCRELWTELKNVLMFWADIGVDGFRCDVASLVPYEFWLEAVSFIKAKHPDLKWFSESIDLNFREALAKNDEGTSSDLDILRLFDGSYNYDIWPQVQLAMKDHSQLSLLSELLNYRYGQQLRNKTKWNFIENHDQARVRANGLSDKDYRMWLSFMLLYPGMGFMYHGQESKTQPDASFFEKEAIKMDLDHDLVQLITRCNQLKKQWVSEGEVWAKTNVNNQVLTLTITTKVNVYQLILNFNDESVLIENQQLFSKNALYDTPITVIHDKIQLQDYPVLIIEGR